MPEATTKVAAATQTKPAVKKELSAPTRIKKLKQEMGVLQITSANEIASLKDQLDTLKCSSDANIAALNKSLESEKSMRAYNGKQAEEYKAELEQLHGLLDAFESQGALPREIKNLDGYSTTKYSAMTRLASWLARKVG